MSLRPLRVWVCILGLLVGIGRSARAEEIRLIAPYLPPFSFGDAAAPKGIMLETLLAVARQVGHSGKVSIIPVPRMLHEIAQGKRMMSAFVAQLQFRARAFTLLDPGVEQVLSFASLRTNPGPMTLETAKHLKSIGLISNGFPEIFLRGEGFTNLDTATTEEASLRKLMGGRVDAWFSSRWVIPALLAQEKIDPDLLQISEPIVRFPLNFAATLDIPADELAPWAAELARFRAAGGVERLIRQYRQAL